MIDRVKQLSLSNKDISAVLMYGSFIRGEGDVYSDIEFYIFHYGEQMDNKLEFISRISPVSLFFENEFGTEVAIFKNMIRGEFHFHPVSDVGMIRSWKEVISFEYRDNMNLVDKDGHLNKILMSFQPPLSPVRDTVENRRSLAENLLNNLLFEQNLLLRKEYAHANKLFCFIQRYILWLIRLYLSNYEHWESPTKKLEEDLPEEWYAEYKQCVPSLDSDSLQKSFRHVLQLSDKLFDLLDIPDDICCVLEKIRNRTGV